MLTLNKIFTRQKVKNVLQVTVILLVSSVFLCQVLLHLIRHLRHATTISVNLVMPPEVQFPVITICPDQPFNPFTLKDLGLDIQGNYSLDGLGNANEIKWNIRALKGIDQSKTAREVWDIAGFYLGEVVLSLTFGGLTEHYTRTTNSSVYWHRTLSPLGVCLSLVLPPVESNTTSDLEIHIRIHKRTTIKQCPVYDCIKMRNFKEFCNSSCAFQNYIAFDTMMPYRILLSKQFREVNKDYSLRKSEYEHLENLLSDDHWQLAQLGLAQEPLNVISVNSLLTDKRSLTCSQKSDIKSDLSFDKCLYEQIQEDFGCTPVQNSSSTILSEACNVTLMQELLESTNTKKFLIQEKESCLQKIWLHNIKHTSSIDALTSSLFEFHLTLSSPKIRVETENELYPLSQFASDFGGSLGLYLGLSVLSLWKYMSLCSGSLLTSPNNKSKQFSHFRRFSYWVIITLLVFSTTLHSLGFFQLYLYQEAMTSVTHHGLFSANSVISNSSFVTIKDHVAARLASRALDCKPGPYADTEECYLKCLMEESLKQVGEVGPFVEIGDLPICSQKNADLFSNMYIVPSLAFATAIDPLLMSKCYKVCHFDSSNISLEPLLGLSINHNYYRFTVIDLLCSFGGTVSLYAGIFLTNVVSAMISILPSRSPSMKVIKRFLRLCLFIFICACGTVLSIFLLHRYIALHPISSSNSNRAFKVSDQPALTICRWPPFTKEFTLNSSLGTEWETASRDNFIIRVAITQSVGKIVNTKGSYNISSVLTPLNKCYTLSANIYFNNLLAATYEWWQDYEDAYISIHNIKDPPFVGTLYRLDNFSESMTLEVIPIHYTKLDQLNNNGKNRYDSCMYHCIFNKYIDDIGCKYPFISWRPDLSQCHSVSFESYPSWLRNSPKHPFAENGSLTCHNDCRHLLKEFYIVRSSTKSWIEPNVNILQERSTFMDIVEEDWYEKSKLISDLGVVIGFTMGTSVLSFLQHCIKKVFSAYDTEHK